MKNLNASVRPHLSNQWRIIEDETNIKFLIEEGGFPGCSDMGTLLGYSRNSLQNWHTG
jgi:hypothetical protein